MQNNAVQLAARQRAGVRSAGSAVRLARIGLALFLAATLRAAESIPASAEKTLKAALVLRCLSFTSLAEAADEAGGTLALAVMGSPDLQVAFNPLNGQTVGERRIRVFPAPTSEDIAPCDAVFIGLTAAADLQAILRTADRCRALTISDIPDFARLGGAVGLARRPVSAAQPNTFRIVIEINLEAAGRTPVRFRAKLLKAAEIVEDGAPRK